MKIAQVITTAGEREDVLVLTDTGRAFIVVWTWFNKIKRLQEIKLPVEFNPVLPRGKRNV